MEKYVKISAVIFGMVFFASCSVLNELNGTHKNDKGAPLAAMVVKNNVNKVEVKGHIGSMDGLKVRLQEHAFTKSSFAKFQKTIGSERYKMKYVDSNAVKPRFYTLDLMDDVGYIQLLKEDENSALYAFAKANPKTRIVTQVSMVMDNKNMDLSQNYFLQKTGRTSQLVGYKNNNERIAIDLSETLVFDSELSYCAWGTSKYNQIQLADIIEEGKSCPSTMARKPSALLKEKSLYKY